MVRVICNLHVDTSGCADMFRMGETLAKALSVAQFDGHVQFASTSEGLRTAEGLIATIQTGRPRLIDGDLVVRLHARPTVRLPLFAAAICRRVPGVRVHWVDGWPLFKAPDDDPGDDSPDPTTPEKLLPCLA